MISVIGIDPGAEGGLVFLEQSVVSGTPDSLMPEPMPQNEDEKPDVRELARLLSDWVPKSTRVYLELPGLRPGESPWATSVSWRNFGQIEGILHMLDARVHVVRAEVWSKGYEHGVTERDPVKRKRQIKVARRGIVQKLYPGLDLKKSDRCKVPHEGMVDALLLAHYGWRQLKEGSIA